MKFMDLPNEYCTDNSFFCILPIEYEKDLTYGEGASKGSSSIIEASKHLEYYDEQYDNEPFIKGVFTLESLKLNEVNANESIEKIASVVSGVDCGFLISLGGDHAVTIGTVKGFEKKNDNFSVIILDAHSDMFHSWNNSQLNHRCVSQRVSEKHKTLLVGIRSMDKDEKEIIEGNENVDLLKMHEFSIEKFKEKLSKLDSKVYLSIDVDVFDPSFIRNTGTPEPGGLVWEQVISVLKSIFESKEVIGCDLVEFAPIENFRAEAYTLAKLVYKLIALKNNNSFKE